MRRKVRTALRLSFFGVFFFACVSLNRYRHVTYMRLPALSINQPHHHQHPNYAVEEEFTLPSRRVSSIRDLTTAGSVLLPDWEVLVVNSKESSSLSERGIDYYCLFQNNATSPAKLAGILPFSNRTTFKCVLPNSVRRMRPFLQPVVTKSPIRSYENEPQQPEIIRWRDLAYESLSTQTDVVLFVKGVNHRQGINRSPSDLRCVFGDDVSNGVRTGVTSSSQEVFRCFHPNQTALQTGSKEPIKISLEIRSENRIVPSVANYTPQRSLEEKSLICACTVVYNMGKFLKEWVIYHSKIGVEMFILYDNGSNDDTKDVIKELLREDYNLKTLLWPWPKTQEAGFSHCSIYAKDHCTWMMFIDVDEFVFSPAWMNSSYPSHDMLKSLLPEHSHPLQSSPSIGQVMIGCREFGPSDQRSHPLKGVTQGYNCRRKVEQRHKSIVLLEAIDFSLLNVIHHFQLKEGYRLKKLSAEKGVVNHYKYQAWEEFKTKFRRRVSAYVADWTQEVNPASKDRTPGLGFEPIEPIGWAKKFCEVEDNGLKRLTHRWFGINSPSGYKMAWENDDN